MAIDFICSNSINMSEESTFRSENVKKRKRQEESGTEGQRISTCGALGRTKMEFDPHIPTFHEENEMLDKKSFLFSRSVWNIIVVLLSFSTR
jgi:hypothetical protein